MEPVGNILRVEINYYYFVKIFFLEKHGIHLFIDLSYFFKIWHLKIVSDSTMQEEIPYPCSQLSNYHI